jgi:hypothetical protein
MMAATRRSYGRLIKNTEIVEGGVVTPAVGQRLLAKPMSLLRRESAAP